MVETKTACKAGRSDVEVQVTWVVYLDEPDTTDTGFKEQGWTIVRPNIGLAKYTAKKYVIDNLLDDPSVDCVTATLIERTWVRDTYFDAEYGSIVDAYARELYATDGDWDRAAGDFIFNERYERSRYV